MTTTELLTQFANPDTLKTLSFANKMLAGLVTTLLGMGITFIALIILQVLISFMDRLINKPDGGKTIDPAAVRASSHTQQTAISKVANSQSDDKELVAVITTVVAMTLKTSVDNIVIKNIKKIEDRSLLWNRAGIIEQINSRF